jgi:hypothetical protein
MPGKPQTIDEYLAALSGDKRAALERLRRTIQAAAPRAEEFISSQIPTKQEHRQGGQSNQHGATPCKAPHPSSSIRMLLAAIGFCGLGLASLRSPSQLWAATLFSLALAGLVASLVGIAFQRGQRRAFWTGFALAGWAYWLVALGPWVGDVVGPRLVTTALLEILNDHLKPAAPETWGSAPKSLMSQLANISPRQGPQKAGTKLERAGKLSQWEVWTEPEWASDGVRVSRRLVLVSSEPFRRIGHSLLTLLVAFTVGVVTGRCAALREAHPHAAPKRTDC